MAVESGGIIAEAWVLIKPDTRGFAPALKADVGKGLTAAEAEAKASMARTEGITGTAVTSVSHHTRRAYADVAAAEANLAATTATYGSKSAEAALAADRLSVSHKKLSSSMESNEKHAARLSGRIGGMGHNIIHSSGALLVGGIAVEEFVKHTAEAAVTYEESMTHVQNATGQTDAEVKELSKGFLEVAKSGESTFTAGAAADAYGAVAGQLKLAHGQALNTAQALRFMKAAEDDAEASGQDLGSVTSGLTQVMQTFHIPLKQVNAEADLLYNVSKSLNVPISSISTAVDKLHARLGAAAPSLGDVSALMVQASRAGITGSRGVLTISSAMQTLLTNSAKAGRGAKATATQIASARITEQTATDAVIKAQATYGTSSEQYVIAVERQHVAQTKLNDAMHGAPPVLTAAQKTLKSLGVEVYNEHGKFVGMSSLIDQLEPKFAKMSDSQRNTAASTLFGSTSAQIMLQILAQGQKGWKQATDAVGEQGTAAAGAAKQQKTLGGETKTLGAEYNALETEVGGKLVPVLASLAGWLAHHQTVTKALAGVIGGVLVLAVARYVGELIWATGQTVKRVAIQVGSWVGLGKASDRAKDKIVKNNLEIAASATETATAVEADSVAEGAAMEGVGVAAGTEAAEVVAADTAIEAESAAAATSIGAIGIAASTMALVALPAIAAVAGALLDLNAYNFHQEQEQNNKQAGAGVIDELLRQAHDMGYGRTKSYRKTYDTKIKPLVGKAMSGKEADQEAAAAAIRALNHQYMDEGKNKHGGWDNPAGAKAQVKAANADGLNKLFGITEKHGKNAESYANTANGLLAKNNDLLGAIAQHTAASAKHSKKKPQFANSENR